MSINLVTVSGNLTRDPELCRTQFGTAILSFCVAVNDRRRNPQTGGWEERPIFVDCFMFGPRAESLSKILRKGLKVAVDGRLRWSQWERDGAMRSKIEVVADDIDLMSARRSGSDGEEAVETAPDAYGSDVYDEDVDF